MYLIYHIISKWKKNHWINRWKFRHLFTICTNDNQFGSFIKTWNGNQGRRNIVYFTVGMYCLVRWTGLSLWDCWIVIHQFKALEFEEKNSKSYIHCICANLFSNKKKSLSTRICVIIFIFALSNLSCCSKHISTIEPYGMGSFHSLQWIPLKVYMYIYVIVCVLCLF